MYSQCAMMMVLSPMGGKTVSITPQFLPSTATELDQRKGRLVALHRFKSSGAGFYGAHTSIFSAAVVLMLSVTRRVRFCANG